MLNNFFKLILVLGAVQGIILISNLLFTKDDKRQAKYFLAALISLIICELIRTLWFVLKIPDYIAIHYFFLCLIFTFSPNLFLYVKSLTQTQKIPKKEIIKTHFYTILVLGFTALILFLNLLTRLPFIDHYGTLLKALMVVFFWGFYRKSFNELQFFKKVVQSDIPQIEREIILKWLSIFLKVILVNAIAWTISIIIQIIYPNQTFYYIFIPIEIAYVVAIYWVGYAGFQRVKIVYLTEQRNTQVFFNSIDTHEIEQCLKKLEVAMEVEKKYLDPELSLQKLAESLKISYRIISAVLNQQLSLGFNEYVNSYRIEEFKKRIKDPKNSHLNIAGVAFDSGFNSLATFQRAFKNITGITPKEFIKEK